jgi:spermidine synthase
VLIAGLGLGMCARACLFRDDVKSVTVVERSRDVIILVGPWLTKLAEQQGKKLTIVEADITTWSSPSGNVYDLAWFDIWDDITTDNLPEMHALHRRFARKAKWKGSWGRDWIERERRAEQRDARAWG